MLAETGLPQKLLASVPEPAGEPSLVVDEAKALLDRFAAGELDLVLVNDELRTDALLRNGQAGKATPLFFQEVVLVGPPADPVGVHAERSLEGALRTIITGDAAFFRCGQCGSRAKEEAIFAMARALPRGGSAFNEVGKTEADVIQAMRGAPAYGFLSRPTVLKLMRDKEWSLKPLWSGDALQVDAYRLVRGPTEKLPPEKKAAILALEAYLSGDQAKAIVAGYGAETYGQVLYKVGAPRLGEGARF